MKHSMALKVTAIILFTLALLCFLLTGLSTAYLAAEGDYDRPLPFSESLLAESLGRAYTDGLHGLLHSNFYQTGGEYAISDDTRASLDEMFDRDRTNLRVRIETMDGTLLYGETDKLILSELGVGLHGFEISLAENTTMPNAPVPTAPPASALPDVTPMPLPAVTPVAPIPTPNMISDAVEMPIVESVAGNRAVYRELTVETYLAPALQADDAFSFFKPVYDTLLSLRYIVLIGAFASLLLMAVSYVYLLSAAGHRVGEDGIHLTWVDRIPTDLFLAAIGIAIAFIAWCCLVVWELFRVTDGRIISTFLLPLVLDVFGVTAISLLFLLGSMSAAARIKAKRFIKGSLVYLVLRFVFRVCKKCFDAVRVVLQNLPTVWKAVLCIVLYVVSIIATVDEGGFWAVIWMLATVLLALRLCHFLIGFDRLKKGAKAIADGDLAAKIDTRFMAHDQREMANDLKNIGGGIQKAVDARMKSERMKTDLITNVSHDLKTPLTSIVNYVDLLKKEELHNETADGYVLVLDRQAQKLKKLTEDIVEASKASSGALNVHLASVDLNELLRQCSAEYAERFACAHLTAVLRLPETPIIAMADGRLLWRVFDNLLGNAVKYAMPETRVYLDAAIDGAEAVITLRNISREPLEQTGDELMERFVRGDASRHAEGSGLGLSIAASLVSLQNGTLTVTPDGDLFRADIRLPLDGDAPEAAPTETINERAGRIIDALGAKLKKE